jgi:hypothetical protein
MSRESPLPQAAVITAVYHNGYVIICHNGYVITVVYVIITAVS